MFTRLWNPAMGLDQLRREMNDVVGQLFDESSPAVRGTRSYPALNVWETDIELFAEAEVPGLKMEDLEVLVEGAELTIRGQRTPTETSGNVHRRERGVGRFSRTVQLPVEINADKVQAVLRDGVLTITLPKAERAKPRKIEVHAAGE